MFVMCNQTIWTILQEKYNNCNDKFVSDFKKFNINLSYNITEGFIIANKNASVYTNYLHFSVRFSTQNKKGIQGILFVHTHRKYKVHVP